ncbi:PH domain-containing protein [Streptomyces sp. NRRL S-495]|uniref:PH domain-containing protein n=1 Tax=Streptomyces sp. NRRL S-495 TaxID=1609133 RepID=UPI00099CFA57|nr:PH domain-containing protein [Streptomyces sp. NRRL S-495]
MSGDRLRVPHEYRVASTRIGGLAFTILLLSFGAMLPIWKDKEFAPSTKAIGSLLVIGFCLLVIVGAARAGTLVTAEGITVRGIVRRRRLPWAEITRFGKAPNPNAHAKGAPAFLTYAFRADGRKVHLPYIDDKHVLVDREVERLNALLAERRGNAD